MIMASGWTTPAAAPCTTRASVSTVSFGARPPRTEPARKTAIETVIVSRIPKARLAQSASSIVAVMAARKPVEIHCACTALMPKAPMTAGMATFTIVVDNTTEMVAIMIEPVAIHL